VLASFRQEICRTWIKGSLSVPLSKGSFGGSAPFPFARQIADIGGSQAAITSGSQKPPNEGPGRD
jgi:hypothetical protein